MESGHCAVGAGRTKMPCTTKTTARRQAREGGMLTIFQTFLMPKTADLVRRGRRMKEKVMNCSSLSQTFMNCAVLCEKLGSWCLFREMQETMNCSILLKRHRSCEWRH